MLSTYTPARYTFPKSIKNSRSTQTQTQKRKLKKERETIKLRERLTLDRGKFGWFGHAEDHSILHDPAGDEQDEDEIDRIARLPRGSHAGRG